MRQQRGASGIFVAVVLILVAAGIIVALAFSKVRSQVEQGGQASATFKIIQDALVQFVAANGRLPCPANPALNTGDADPNVASPTCTSPTGTVPWRTLGIRSDDAIDPWGNKVTYRVYAGVTGLTQAGGASMVNCDTVEPSPAGADGLGLCKATQDTTEAQFVAGKGLTVNSFGAAIPDAAYVLLSHGASGLGAWTSAGQQKSMPANAQELANTTAAGPFAAQAASAADVGAEDAVHFDDLLAYATIGDLIRRAGAGARDWPEPAGPAPLSQVNIHNDLPAAMGSTPSYGDLGQLFVSFNGATVIGADLGGIQNLSYDNYGGAGDGLGVNGSLVSSADGELLIIGFTQNAAKLGFTLNNFGSKACASGTCAERVRVTFFNGGTNLGTITKTACNTTSEGLATYTIDALTALGSQFNAIVLQPISTLPANTFTDFSLSEFASCSSSSPTCATSLSDPANVCP
jgi:hypothetical protein